MKTASNNRPTARLAATVCVALIFGTGSWAQPNPDYQMYLADESVKRIESFTTPADRSVKYSETIPKTESQSTRNLKKISINTIFLDMNIQDGPGTDDLDSKLNRKNNLIEKYGQETGMDINNRKLWIGMTSKMVYESIGEPCDVYVHTDDTGTHIQWAYWLYNICLSFENDILVSCQDY